MSLPKVVAKTSTVDVDGQPVPVRGLTRGENAHVSRLIEEKKLEAAEVFILAKGTDLPEHEAKEWYDTTNSGVVDSVLKAIQKLTGISGEAQKSST